MKAKGVSAIVKKGWYRKDTLNSGYIYQVYAFLISQVPRMHGNSDSTEELVALLDRILTSATVAPTTHRFK